LIEPPALQLVLRAVGAVRSPSDQCASGVVLGPGLSLVEVMAQHPQLNNFGIGLFDTRGKTAEQCAAELADGRDKLAGRKGAVLEIAAWLLENIAPIKTPTIGSYTMKHVVEGATGDYMTNGELIAAALVAGYPVRFVPGPNPLFGMSARDLTRIGTAPRPRGRLGGWGSTVTAHDDLDD
jgi:hypothetical protein